MNIELAQPYLGIEPGSTTGGGMPLVSRGKVRDIYELDAERLLFVTTDRISAFDVVLRQGIPHKGRLLTAIAASWFERTSDIVPHHLLSSDVEGVGDWDESEREGLRGRTMIVRKAKVLPVEWIVRAYITGSGWKEYQRTGAISGVALPAGLEHCQRFERPILTPTTKSDVHDAPMTPDEARATVGEEIYRKVEATSLALFERGTRFLAERGILLADTKFEFGLIDGEVVLIDEALTPDSSRFWPADAWEVGKTPPSYDKQILRNHLETLDWNKEYPAPDLDPEIVDRITRKYIEICRTITGGLPEGVEA